VPAPFLTELQLVFPPTDQLLVHIFPSAASQARHRERYMRHRILSPTLTAWHGWLAEVASRNMCQSWGNPVPVLGKSEDHWSFHQALPLVEGLL
jgi:hypothetical protein